MTSQEEAPAPEPVSLPAPQVIPHPVVHSQSLPEVIASLYSVSTDELPARQPEEARVFCNGAVTSIPRSELRGKVHSLA